MDEVVAPLPKRIQGIMNIWHQNSAREKTELVLSYHNPFYGSCPAMIVGDNKK